jgi:hypothetical protein
MRGSRSIRPFWSKRLGKPAGESILIDQQHGLGGHDEMVACLTAAKAAGMPALVRVADNDAGLVGRALDAGAQGVVCPLINSAEDAEHFVRAVKYPPRGTAVGARIARSLIFQETTFRRRMAGQLPVLKSRQEARLISSKKSSPFREHNFVKSGSITRPSWPPYSNQKTKNPASSTTINVHRAFERDR